MKARPTAICVATSASLNRVFWKSAIGRPNVRLQKVRNPLIGIYLVLHAGEAVAFVLVNFVVRHSTVLFDRVHNLNCLFFRTTGIMSSGQ